LNSIFNDVNKKRVVSTLFLYLSIFSIGCDFESPQKWETPSWYLPLTVPLINTVYSFEGMAQDSTIIKDSLNNTLKIIFSNNIAEDGARPGITDDIFDFKIPKTEQLDLFESPPIDMPNLPPVKIGGESISIPVPIFAFSSYESQSVTDLCFSTRELDKPVYDELPDAAKDPIPILSNLGDDLNSIEIEGVSVIKELHLITITGGKLGVRYTNSLPFPVKRFNVKFISNEYTDQSRIIRDIEFQDIAVGDSGENSDIDITSDNPVQFGDEMLIELTIEIDISDDYSNLNPNSDACQNLTSFPVQIEDGWVIDPTASIFSVDIEFEIAAESAQNIICTTNPIIIEQAIDTEFPPIENIDVKGGKMTAVTITDSPNELNYIELIATNSLFTSTDIEITFSNFFDIIDDVGVPVVVGGQIENTGLETIFSDRLASKFLGVPGSPESILESIAVGVKVQINEIIDSPIPLGQSYALSINKLLIAEMNLAYLTAVTYDMGFDTPSSNIEGVPQGGVGLQFYDVQLILDIYTQIGIPIQLDMLLKGLKGTDSVMAVINPELNVPEINTTGDSVRTIITLNKDGQKVEWYHMDNIDGEIPDSTIITPIKEGESTIVDVMNFSPEKIEFGGGAAISGPGFLAPNSFLWGTFTLVAPLAFFFEQPVNILPATPTAMAPMDPSTSQQIDSALVETALNVTITNSSPLGGSLSLLISDSTIFPLFLDSLATGSWDSQLYDFNTEIWDTLDPPLEIDSIYFTAIDPNADTTKALEVKFYNDDSMQFFIGRLFELGFPRADSIEYHLGYVNPEFPNIEISNMVIDSIRMDWVITDESRYNIAMITFDTSPTIPNTEEYIPLTFQTTNTIGVQAYLTLMLDTGGLGRNLNSNDK